MYKHLENPGVQARPLLAYLPSAFIKIHFHILNERLASCFNLPDQLLTQRAQQVFTNVQNIVNKNRDTPGLSTVTPLISIADPLKRRRILWFVMTLSSYLYSTVQRLTAFLLYQRLLNGVRRITLT